MTSASSAHPPSTCVLPQAGPSKQMNWYNPGSGMGSTSPAGRRGNDGDAMNGNAVLYDAVAGKIFTCGGAPSYQVGSWLFVLGLRQS